MNPDGTTNSVIANVPVQFFNIVDATVYYIESSGEFGGIYSMTTAGTGRRNLLDHLTSRLIYHEGWLYYLSLNEGFRVFRMKPDGSQRALVSDVPARLITLNRDKLYYVPPEGMGLYSLRIGDTSYKGIEATLSIKIVREGLILVSESPLALVADGCSSVVCKITALRIDDGKASTDYELLSKLRFDDRIQTDLQLAANAFETAGLEIVPAGWEKRSGPDPSDPDCYVYKIKTKRYLPGRGEKYFGLLSAAAADQSGKTWRIRIPLLFDPELLESSSEAQEIELEYCRKTIRKVPAVYQPKLNEILDRQGPFLGAKGLSELRHRIWRIGQLLWEAEGLSGYEDVARWAGYLENACQFTEFVCKLVLNILLTTKIGIFKALAAGEVYSAVISALKAWQEGIAFNDWINTYFLKKFLPELAHNMGGEMVEQALEEWIKKDPKATATAVLLLFLFYWTTNLAKRKIGGEKYSFYDAAKEALIQVSIIAAGKYLASTMQHWFGKQQKPLDPEASPAVIVDTKDFEKGILKAKGKISALREALEKGDPEQVKKLVLEGKSDKYFITEINKIHQDVALYPDELKKIVNEVFNQEIKAPVKEVLDKKVLDFYTGQGYSKVELVFESKSNPSAVVKVGSDWDVSCKVTALNKIGKPVVLNMQAAELNPLLEDAVSGTIGGKYLTGMTKKELLHHIDISAIREDALGGYGKNADAAISLKSSGEKLEQFSSTELQKGLNELKGVDLSDPAVLDKLPPPANLLAKIKIEEPSTLSRGATHKELEWFDAPTGVSASVIGEVSAGIAKQEKMLEGMKQLAKQYNNLLVPMKGISEKALNDKTLDIPSLLRNTVDLFSRGKSPEYIEQLLQKKGSFLRAVTKIFDEKMTFYSNRIAGLYKQGGQV